MKINRFRIIFFIIFFSFFIEDAFAKEAWQKVYLATFPRSGNHWTRYLIEEATGIITSSSYPEGFLGIGADKKTKPHSPFRLPWGGYCCKNGYEGIRRYPEKGEIVIIKTHYPFYLLKYFDSGQYEKAIRIVRHPVDSIYSLYLFMGYSPEDNIPFKLLKKYIHEWKKFHEFWNNHMNVDTYLYEDMMKDPYGVFTSIMESTGYEFTDEDIKRAVDRYPPEGKPYKHFDKFEQDQLDLIITELQPLLDYFGYPNTNQSE